MTVRKPASTFLFALCLSLVTAIAGAGFFVRVVNAQKNKKLHAPATSTTRAQSTSETPSVTASQTGTDQQVGRAGTQDAGRGTGAQGGRNTERALTQNSRSASGQNNPPATGGQQRGDNPVSTGSGENLQQSPAGETPHPTPKKTGTEEPKSTDEPKKTEPTFVDSILAWVPTVLLSLAALGLIGLLFWLTLATIKAGEARMEGLIRGLSKKQDDRFQELSAAVSGLKDLSGRVVALQDSVFRLGQRIQTGQDEQRLNRRLSEERDTYNNVPTAASNFEPPADEYADDSMDFPIAVNSFLTRLGNQQLVVKPDPLKGILVKDPEKRGQFVLARDGSVPGGYFYIVPRIVRFQAQEDFYNHFEQFYDCARPVAGEVWVNEPATVDPVDGGWKLRDKGILEVKS
jgi:hypothetical protein